jgi:hypothetical protein
MLCGRTGFDMQTISSGEIRRDWRASMISCTARAWVAMATCTLHDRSSYMRRHQIWGRSGAMTVGAGRSAWHAKGFTGCEPIATWTNSPMRFMKYLCAPSRLGFALTGDRRFRCDAHRSDQPTREKKGRRRRRRRRACSYIHSFITYVHAHTHTHTHTHICITGTRHGNIVERYSADSSNSFSQASISSGTHLLSCGPPEFLM